MVGPQTVHVHVHTPSWQDAQDCQFFQESRPVHVNVQLPSRQDAQPPVPAARTGARRWRRVVVPRHATEPLETEEQWRAQTEIQGAAPGTAWRVIEGGSHARRGSPHSH